MPDLEQRPRGVHVRDFFRRYRMLKHSQDFFCSCGYFLEIPSEFTEQQLT